MTGHSKHREWLEGMSREFVDKGLLIEAGWMSFRAAAISMNAPDDQLREMRLAFFAGAQHLFGSMMTILDPDAEPTEDDLKRMENINTELNNFLAVTVQEMRDKREGQSDGLKN
jgi:hypothetical protein